MAYDEVTDTKSSALWQTERNALGRVTRSVDPDGRELRFTYAANGTDLTKVELRDGAAWQTLATLSNYLNHRPRTIGDGAGLTTAITYNSVMQPEMVTVSKGANSEPPASSTTSTSTGRSMKKATSSKSSRPTPPTPASLSPWPR